ncbi:MAG TPA: prepilin-type N-terminal cleavage/methylation domain-containing protein [Longimicrobiales bacterium]
MWISSRDGFTITELLIVLILMGIVGGFAVMRIGGTLAETRAQRAASVIAADLKLAHSLAGRQRMPVRLSIDTVNRVIRIRDYTTPGTVYAERHFGGAGEYPVDRLTVSDTSLLVYPNGLAADDLSVWVRAASQRRLIRMTRAGLVRVSEP